MQAASTDQVLLNYCFKLLAIKDEYEVARLFAAPEFMEKLRQQFEGEVKLSFHLAPPLSAQRDPATGHLKKREYGAWMMMAFKLLSRLRRLRGTWLDPFGYTAERKLERRLIADYEAVIEEILAGLNHDNHALALALAGLPDEIRGYGHIKEANLEKAEAQKAEYLSLWRNPEPTRSAAE